MAAQGFSNFSTKAADGTAGAAPAAGDAAAAPAASASEAVGKSYFQLLNSHTPAPSSRVLRASY